jgi:hypothetical protein
VETFTHSGALSISTVPRAAAALVVAFDPRGPRRAYIDYIHLNPEPCGRYPGAGLNSAAAADAHSGAGSNGLDFFSGMPLAHIVMLHSVMIGSAMLCGTYRSHCFSTANIEPPPALTLCRRSKFFRVADPNLSQIDGNSAPS